MSYFVTALGVNRLMIDEDDLNESVVAVADPFLNQKFISEVE